MVSYYGAYVGATLSTRAHSILIIINIDTLRSRGCRETTSVQQTRSLPKISFSSRVSAHKPQILPYWAAHSIEYTHIPIMLSHPLLSIPYARSRRLLGRWRLGPVMCTRVHGNINLFLSRSQPTCGPRRYSDSKRLGWLEGREISNVHY